MARRRDGNPPEDVPFDEDTAVRKPRWGETPAAVPAPPPKISQRKQVTTSRPRTRSLKALNLDDATEELPQGTGFPDATTGLPNAGTGFPNAGTGFPNAGTGFPNAGTGFPNAGTGFPNAGTNFPNPGTNLPEDAAPASESFSPREDFVLEGSIVGAGGEYAPPDAPPDDEPAFFPDEPETCDAAGLTATYIEHLLLKILLDNPGLSGDQIAESICLNPSLIRRMLLSMKRRMLVVHTGGTMGGDFCYDLAGDGRQLAMELRKQCPYAGPAPVTMESYRESVFWQSISRESPKKDDLERAFSDLMVPDDMLDLLGPAMTSGKGLFLFGNPGNGKTSIALRMIQAYGTSAYIPHAVLMNGTVVQIYDPQVHVLAETDRPNAFGRRRDRRWMRTRRPVVVVGGELTLDSLELEQTGANLCEASIQLKANCGVLVLDDFGRQREDPTTLLNRWILPLESRVDFLRTPNGRKIEVPFDPMLIFSTNLDPKDLVDEAFIRRIPYKINFPDPTPKMFRDLMAQSAEDMGFYPDLSVIDYMISKYYTDTGRQMRFCHPRDLLLQVRNRCLYLNTGLELTAEGFDLAARAYFTLL